MNQQFLTELKAVTAENRIFTDEPMKKHTTFRVGGPADILVQPKGTELAAVIRLCRKYDVPYQVIGNGSNLLVGDRGIRGLVIEMLSKEDEICVEDDCITVGGNAAVKDSKPCCGARTDRYGIRCRYPGQNRWCSCHECGRLRW